MLRFCERKTMSEEDDASVHRLEASGPVTGGLVVKKKDSDSSTFKVPKVSLLGLDRLAAQKRKEREDQNRLISFKDNEYDDDASEHKTIKTPEHSGVHKLSRHYRELKDETPSHGGGVSDKARDRLAERSEKDKRGVYVSTKDEKRKRSKDDYDRNYDKRDRDKDRHRDRDRDRHRDSDRRREKDRDYDRRRDRSTRDSGYSDRRKPSDSERSLHTPRFRDEPRTPYTATASSSWDDDDEKPTSKRSSWDFPTPKDGDRRSEWSTRSNMSSISRLKKSTRMEDDTPRPTPAHKFNAWANDRKRTGATPRTSMFQIFYSFQLFYSFFINIQHHINVELTNLINFLGQRDGKQPWADAEERDIWEEEQRRLDREWYNMDEGFDDDANPFGGANSEYFRKREEQLEQKTKKRISAQQRQNNKDNELWERNRMLTSGVVQSINVNDDFDEEAIERVHLLVHHIVPPFLDGRIVFTKQPEPVSFDFFFQCFFNGFGF